jgi:hypothetical protein
MKPFFYLVTLLFSLLLIASCQDDDNGTVPDGPQGPQGPAGTAGQDVALEVIYKDIALLPADWYHISSTTNHNDTTAVVVTEITQTVIDSGLVIAYHRVGNAYHLMPHAVYYGGLAQVVFGGYFYTGGFVFTYYSNFVGGPHAGAQNFRLMIANGPLRVQPPLTLPLHMESVVRDNGTTYDLAPGFKL